MAGLGEIPVGAIEESAELQNLLAKHDAFQMRLTDLLNEFSMENASDTRDFIIADFMIRCLTAFDIAVMARDKMGPMETDGNLLIESKNILHALIYHDERGQGVGFNEAMVAAVDLVYRISEYLGDESEVTKALDNADSGLSGADGSVFLKEIIDMAIDLRNGIFTSNGSVNALIDGIIYRADKLMAQK